MVIAEKSGLATIKIKNVPHYEVINTEKAHKNLRNEWKMKRKKGARVVHIIEFNYIMDYTVQQTNDGLDS